MSSASTKPTPAPWHLLGSVALSSAPSDRPHVNTDNARRRSEGGGVFSTCIVLLLACVTSCRNDHKAETKVAATDENQRLPELFASKLAKASGMPANANTVRVGAHSLSLQAEVEQVATRPDGRVLAGVKVACNVDGKPVEALMSGSVGIDSTRDAALVTAAEEWATQYGSPIVDALSAKPPTLVSGGYKVHAGPTGIRGGKPEGLSEVNANFFRTVEPALATLIPSQPGLHSMTITAMRNADGSIDGEFRVDGKVSEQLKKLALQVMWPTSTGSYMLKQYYVMRGE
jgi:hypothetical protein